MTRKKLRIPALLTAVFMIIASFAAMAVPAAADDISTMVKHGIGFIYVSTYRDNGADAGFPLPVTDDSGRIIAYKDDPESNYGIRGTGFFIGKEGEDPQYIVTNYHVIEEYNEWNAGEQVINYGRRATIRVYFNDNDYEEAYLVDWDTRDSYDIAILRLDKPTNKRSPLKLCIPDDNMSGDQIRCIGYPGDADNIALSRVSQRSEKDAIVTTGTISTLTTVRGSGVRCIQTDARISPGNSGGPMVNENGSVIGMNTWTVGGEIYYAINIAEVKLKLDQNNIPYEMESEEVPPPPPPSPENDNSLIFWILIGVIIIVVIAVVIIVIRMLRSHPNDKDKHFPETEGPDDNEKNKRIIETPGDTGLRIEGLSGAYSGKRIMIKQGGVIIIGRAPNECNVILPENTKGVSRKHCEIKLFKGDLRLTDLGSTHGTFVSPGRKLNPNETVNLKEGSIFWLGSEDQKFIITSKRG